VGQTLDSQLEQLRAAGCTAKIYREKVTGAHNDRRELLKMLKALAPGDVVTVTRIAVIGDSVNAVRFQVAFYYGLAGLACAWHFRKHALTRLGQFIFLFAWPFARSRLLPIHRCLQRAKLRFDDQCRRLSAATAAAGTGFFVPGSAAFRLMHDLRPGG
jgi:hypothetical protein